MVRRYACVWRSLAARPHGVWRRGRDKPMAVPTDRPPARSGSGRSRSRRSRDALQKGTRMARAKRRASRTRRTWRSAPTERCTSPTSITAALRAIDSRRLDSHHRVRPDLHASVRHRFGADGILYVETDDNDRGGHSSRPARSGASIPRARTAMPRSSLATSAARAASRCLADGRLVIADHMHHTLSILDPVTGDRHATRRHARRRGLRQRDRRRRAVRAAVRSSCSSPTAISMSPSSTIIGLRRVTLAGVVTDFAGTAPPATSMARSRSRRSMARKASRWATTTRSTSPTSASSTSADQARHGQDGRGRRHARLPRLRRATRCAVLRPRRLDVDATRLVIADGNIGDGNAFHRIRVIALSAL